MVKDPDVAVQPALPLVCHTLLARPSVSQGVRLWPAQGLRRPRRHRNGETSWRTPTVAAVSAIWRHPASTGTVGDGKTRPQPQPGRPRPRPPRLAPPAWNGMGPNRSPAAMTWKTFERRQAIVEANEAAYAPHRRRGGPRQGAALVQGLVACGICGHTMVVPYTGGHPYRYTARCAHTQAPVCQRLPADPVDQPVVAALLPTLAPAALDLYEQALQRRQPGQAEGDRAPHDAVPRLHYEADRARRRDERGAPEQRLVADDLERRWEAALQALPAAEDHHKRRQQAHPVVPLSIPRTRRQACTALGTSLPTGWQQEALSRAQRTALWRGLSATVVRPRVPRELLRTRLVWRGGAVSELAVPWTVGARHDLTGFPALAAQMRALEAQGQAAAEIAPLLSTRGCRAPPHAQVRPRTVHTLRVRHGRLPRYRGPRPRAVPGRLPVSPLAAALGVKAPGVDHLIRRGRSIGARDPATRLDLFPDPPATRHDFRRVQHGHSTPLQDGPQARQRILSAAGRV